MSFLTRLLVPRRVRRAVHPGRAVKRAVTPKSVKQARRALHPVSNAKYSVERSLNTKKKRRSRAPVWRHPGCMVAHRTQAAADKCPNGRPKSPRTASAPKPSTKSPAVKSQGPPAPTAQNTRPTSKPPTALHRSVSPARPRTAKEITPEYLSSKIDEGEQLNHLVEAVLSACGASSIRRQGNRIEALSADGHCCAVFPSTYTCGHGGVSYYADSAPEARVTIVSTEDFDPQARRVAAERAVTLLTRVELEALAHQTGIELGR